MVSRVFLVFLTCLQITFAYYFLRLNGYTLLASQLQVYEETPSPKTCGVKCVNAGINCIGFQMVWDSGSCVLLEWLRGYTKDIDQCGYFIRDDNSYTVSGRIVTGIDELIQNNLYVSSWLCPDGFTNTIIGCALSMDEATCFEYIRFLNAKYNETTGKCNIPALRRVWKCPDTTPGVVGTMSDGTYCYTVLTYIYNSTDLTYKRPESECAFQTGGKLASIHSSAENQLVQSLLLNTNKKNIIGLITNDSITLTSRFRWTDETKLTYTNWFAGEPVASPKFYMVVMTFDGTWTTVGASSVKDVTGIVCKLTANLVVSV